MNIYFPAFESNFCNLPSIQSNDFSSIINQFEIFLSIIFNHYKVSQQSLFSFLICSSLFLRKKQLYGFTFPM